MANWYRLDVQATLSKLESDVDQGLGLHEIQRRRDQHGPNELIETGGRGPWRIVWEQLANSMVGLLVAAAVVSTYLGEFTDAAVILAIVGINAILGFVQDYRAEKALAALKKLAVPTVRVRRAGTVKEISARELTPGDIILLEAGNCVPADCRLVQSINLRIEEAALTGESEPVEKQIRAIENENLPLGDRTNMAYMGTVVAYGHGEAVVTAIGMGTELGKIASSLQSVKSEATPLQRRLAQLGRALALVAIGIVAVIFFMGIARGEEPRLMLMTALSLAVAVVPEGLPAVAAVALALGARKMFLRNALIRKLPAVETLGSVTTICSDKTGTLTQNQMTVTTLDLFGDRIDFESIVAARDASDQVGPTSSETSSDLALTLLFAGAGLCNDAKLESDFDSYHAIGDPTEGALAIAAAKFGLQQDCLAEAFPRKAETPFDSDRKRMTTIHLVSQDAKRHQGLTNLKPFQNSAGRFVAFTKGSVDGLVNSCSAVWRKDQRVPLNHAMRDQIVAANNELASNGMRVLGVAFRELDKFTEQPSAEMVEQDLTFVGMLGMLDPPRPEVALAVQRCRTAGIRIIMITGDHPLTAKHIADQLRLADKPQVLTGIDVETMNEDELRSAVRSTSIFARVAPTHKLRLVQALQDEGQVVAMTGDGVNDAPALKQAHIGVAMGITGTDVSKEASEMILLDDNFATIVNAVEQGRIVYDNIRKFVKYTMTSNAGEIWVMVLGPFLGMPLPLLPFTDSLDQPSNRWSPRTGAGDRESGKKHHATTTLSAQGAYFRWRHGP